MRFTISNAINRRQDEKIQNTATYTKTKWRNGSEVHRTYSHTLILSQWHPHPLSSPLPHPQKKEANNLSWSLNSTRWKVLLTQVNEWRHKDNTPCVSTHTNTCVRQLELYLHAMPTQSDDWLLYLNLAALTVCQPDGLLPELTTWK